MDFLLIFVISTVASILSSMSGGGSSIIALPAFLALGIPFPMAVSMQKVNACFWVLPSARNYLRDETIDWKFIFITGIIGLGGALVGVTIVVSLDQELLKIGVGALILAIVTYFFFRKNEGLVSTHETSKTKEYVAYLASLPVGLYEGILGAGNGLLYATLAIKACGFDFAKALGHYYVVAFPWVLLAAIILASKGYFDWELMIPTVLGSVVGGYGGSAFAKYKGNKFIRFAFLTVGGILGLKLVLGI